MAPELAKFNSEGLPEAELGQMKERVTPYSPPTEEESQGGDLPIILGQQIDEIETPSCKTGVEEVLRGVRKAVSC